MAHRERSSGRSDRNDGFVWLARSHEADAGLTSLSRGLSLTPSKLLYASDAASDNVNMTISLAFLAPKLVRAAVEGRLPRGINIERLRDAPAEWSRQFEALGLNPQQ
jgi:site-specific DNA recombinase